MGNQSCLSDDSESDDVENLQYLNESSNASDVNENEDEEDETWYAYIKQTVKSQAYNMSGLERFKTQPKKPKYAETRITIIET